MIRDFIEFLIQFPHQLWNESKPCPHRLHNPEKCGLAGHVAGMEKASCNLYNYKYICLHARLERKQNEIKR